MIRADILSGAFVFSMSTLQVRFYDGRRHLPIVSRFNSSVHAGPLAAMKGNPADDFLGYAATLLSRVANLVTAQHRLRISTGAQSTIDAFAVKSLTSTA